MKARLVYSAKASSRHDQAGEELPAGTVIDHPQAYILVRNGHAEPADDECRIKANMTPDQLAAAQRNYPAIAKGITPDDRADFFAGKMDGYNPDGTKIPGPNAVDDSYDELADEEYDDYAE
jgi:hypothetical protein